MPSIFNKYNRILPYVWYECHSECFSIHLYNYIDLDFKKYKEEKLL